MDFFQRLGNFFTGKGWVSDEEKRRKEQQAQQPQQRPQPVQQPQLNSQPRMNMPWANSSGGLNQSSQPKVNLNPLQQANQVNQQLNINSQNNQAKPQLTVDDAPKMLTPEGQQDWVNKQNKQIQIQNANSQPIQQPRPQQVQQPQPQAPKPVSVQPQQPRPQTITSPNVINQQNDMRRMGIDPNPVHTAIQHANDELNQYRTAQSNRQDIIDNKMRARGVSEPEIAKSRQTRIQLENQARASADEARRSQNMANIVGAVTAPGRAVASAAKGFIDGAGRTVGDTGDKMSLAIADAMYGITGDEKYNKTRQRIIQQGQQRNAQYDKQFGVFKKNDTDVDVAYELGQSGQRLIQDMGTGVATAGVAPVVRAFAENAADFVTDANAHGKNTRDVLPAAYANAAAQAAIEKVGLDRVLSPGGKTVARRMIKSALAEGGEEAAQQLTENAFAKHTYDPDRKYSEGVVKSALMGAALGGPAGAGNFGGVRQTENQPSAAMSAQIAQSQPMQQQATGKLEQEALAQRQARQSEQQQTQQAQPQIQNQNTNQNAGYSDFYRRPAENTSLHQAAEVNAVNTQTNQTHPIQQVNVNQTVETTMPNASPALKQAVSRNISDIQHGDTNAIATRQQTTGKLENYLIEQATQNVQDTVAQDVRYKLGDQSDNRLDELLRYQLNDEVRALVTKNYNLLNKEIESIVKDSDTSGILDESLGYSKPLRELRWDFEDIDADDTFNDIVSDIVSAKMDELGLEFEPVRGDDYDARRILPQNTGKTDAEVNDMIDDALTGLGLTSEESHSWAAGSIPSRYIELFGEQVRVANHHNNYGNQYEVVYSDNDLRDSTITKRQIQSDVLGELERLVEDADIEEFVEGNTVPEKLESLYYAGDFTWNSDTNSLEYLGKKISPQDIDPNDFSESVRESLVRIIGEKKAEIDGTRYKLSPAQEEYFKDSKIRDENGNLKTVYHGTKSNFDEFSRRKIGSATDPGLYGAGFYFSDHEGISRNYGDRVIKAHLNIKNPLNLGDFNSKESLAEHLRISPDILSDSGGFIHPTTSHTSNFSSALRYAGYDGVIIPHTTKGARGNEIVALDPEQIKYIDNLNPTDGPDMRYRIDAEAQNTSDAKQDLINRSREVMGDSAVLFADLGTFNGRDIDGFYRDVEGVVYIAEGKPSLNTLNHELVHRVMANVDDRARNSAIDYIVKTNGAENLVTEYRRKGYDIKLDEQGVKIAAEEKLADDFMEYAKARAKGMDINILGKRLHIPGEIIAYFERVWQSVRSFAGKADLAKQLYAQMETGKFRGIAPQTRDGVEGSLAYKIDPESAKDAIARFNSVKNGWRRKTIMSRITPELAQMYSEATGFRVSSNAKLVLTDNAVRHMKNSGHLDGKGRYGIEDTNPITNADIADIPLVFAEPDSIKVKGQKGYRGEKIELSKQLDNMHILAVELEQKPNGDFYIVSYYNKSRSPRQAQASGSQGLDADFSEVPTSSRPKRPREANDESIPNTSQNVNTDPRYKLDQSQNQSKPSAIDNLNSSDASERALRSFNSVKRGKQVKSIVGQLSENGARKVAAALQSTDFNQNARLIIDKNAVNHLRNSGHLTGMGRNGTDANPLTETDIRALPHVFSDPDVVYASGSGRTGKRMVFERQLDNHHRIVAELEYSGKDFNLVTYFNINKDLPNGKPAMSYSPEGAVAADESGRQPSRPERSSGDPDNGFNGSVANNIENVNTGHTNPYEKPRPSMQDSYGSDAVSMEWSKDKNGNWLAKTTPEKDSGDPGNEKQVFKNVPMEDEHLITKGNLYEQTKPGIQDDWTKPFRDGDYEYRIHTKRSRNGKKSFTNFERRYIDENGEPGDWTPTSRAAYIWKSQTKSIDKVNRSEVIQKALRAAKQDGEVQEFMAYKNPGRDGGVMVMPLTGEHSIDGGFVRNPKTGEIEGNYIQVTPFGVVHQTNGKFDVVEADRLTNALGKSKGSVFDNFNRLIEKNIHDEEGQKVLKDLYYQKTEAYAKYADVVKSLFAKHNAVADLLDKSRGKFTSSKRFWEDVGRYTEGIFPTSGPDETMNEAFARKYGTQAAERVKTYDVFMREHYDVAVDDLNAIRRMYGKEEIPYLKNYMPHIQKRSGLLGRAADRLLTALPTGVRGDIEGQSRGEIPASIAGLSADFKPGHKFNPNEKHRHGGMMDYEKDPRKAFEYYMDVMLYNTYMEPVIARGRQIESSMRATDMAKKSGTFIDPDSSLAQGDTVSNKATIAVQDFVNEMAGKSSSLDRPFIDRANKHIQVIQRLESINGANKILGNLSSTLAQALNLPETVRDNGLRSTGRAFLTAFDKNTKEAMRKSPFLRERYTDTDGNFTRSGYQKVTDKISVVSGMNLVEKKFIQLNWAANYYSAKKKGLTGYQLIKAADQATERAVGGRGIGAMPQAYKSTLGKMFLQFTYETNESWKNNIAHAKRIGSDIKQLQFKDAGGGAVRAAEAFAVAYGMNMLIKQITGTEPLANMYDAIKDALSNDADDDGEDDKLGQKIARIGSEASKMNAVASAVLNMMPKSEREKIFGKSSDLGRFDGATGVAQTAANVLGAGFYAAQGDSENAQKNLQGLIPAGGQIKKTMGGIKVLQDGGDVYIDKDGKEHTNFEVDSGNVWNQAKAILFGKNAVRPDDKSAPSTGGGDSGRTARDFERGLKKGTYKVQDGLLVNKDGDVQRSYYKALAENQGESDEAYSNWMKAYNIDDVSTLKKEFKSSNDILNKLENGEKKDDKAKSAVDILMGKHKDLPDWAKERYYKESGYSKEQIEYGAMTTHKEVSLMDNYWRQKAQESSHEELMQALTNGRRKSIVGQMFAKNGIVNKLKAEGYITKQEAKALNAAEFDVDGNRITKEGSDGSGSGRGGSGRGRDRSGVSTASPLISAAVKSINSLSSAAPRANKTSGSGRSIEQIGKNLISKMNTQKQVNTALKQWNGGNSSKKPRVRTTKARA
jgi:hypothetical protein